MSLLLDARKKSQQAQAAAGDRSGSELSLEPHPNEQTPVNSAYTPSAAAIPDDRARMAGQNLFDAKSSRPASGGLNINRNLLFALLGAVVLLAAGGSYVWYATSSPQPAHPINQHIAQPAEPAPAPQPQQLVPNVVSAQAAAPAQAHAATRPRKHAAARVQDKPILIEQHQDDPIDPLLNNAYLAYRSGNYDQAQQLYLKALGIDPDNTDALLGLAVIAQRRGMDNMAAHYYAQVLTLDPRNAVANAGMSALSNDDNRESRLKTLLNEQQNSSSLHFALGNFYAGQARWGEAQQSYFNAYKLESGNAELAFNLAVSLDRLGQKQPAVQYYQRALQLDPDHHAAFDHAKTSQRIEALTH